MPRQMKNSKRFEKSVKAIVQEELKEEAEEKTAVIGLSSVSVARPEILSGNVGSSSNFVKIFPFINQGLGQYNSRIGNEIRLKHLDIKMLLQYVNGDSVDQTNYVNQNIGIRVMILRQKDDNDYNQFLTDAQTDKLLENGSVISPGPSNFAGTTINLLQKINRDQFSVRYDKVHYMTRSRRFNDGANQLQFNRPPRPTVVSKRLTFGKKGLKLTFGNSASSSPTNFPYVLVIGYASVEAGTIPNNNLVEYTYTANAVYTDV